MAERTREAAVATRSAAEYDDSIQHLALINAKRQQMYERMLDAETQMFHRLAVQFTAGEVDQWDLVAVLDSYRAVAAVGYTTRWDATVPVSSRTLFGLRATAVRRARGIDRHLPNGPAGTWQGGNPVGRDEARPPNGTSVVYVLYDAGNVPCYVGSTAWFDGRIRQHRHGGKEFARWMAHACADREAAYELERRLLREFKPYLNVAS